AFLNRRRAVHEKREETTWSVDIGDHMDRVDPITEASMGRANVELLNGAKYDVATLGSNEGITLSYQNLTRLYQAASLPVVCSNLKSLRTQVPQWLARSTSLTSKHGGRVGFLGLTAPFNPYYHLLEWHAGSREQSLAAEITSLKEESDVIVLVSHLGIYDH